MKGKRIAITSIILGALSVFYTFVFCVHNILLYLFSDYNFLWKNEAINFAFLLIIISSLLAIIFGIIAHKKGYKFKYKIVGIIMGCISIVISVIVKILF